MHNGYVDGPKNLHDLWEEYINENWKKKKTEIVEQQWCFSFGRSSTESTKISQTIRKFDGECVKSANIGCVHANNEHNAFDD